jgi:hypothetical protein
VRSDRPSSPPERTLHIARTRSAVEDAHRFAALVVGQCDSACVQATTLVVAELVENIRKYGGAAGQATIAIGVDDDLIRVRARNVVASDGDAHQAMATISRISAAPDVRELYRDRLRELFGNPAIPRAQLGLLRVAFEGGFRLSCSFTTPVLEIVAERHGRTR